MTLKIRWNPDSQLWEALTEGDDLVVATGTTQEEAVSGYTEPETAFEHHWDVFDDWHTNHLAEKAQTPYLLLDVDGVLFPIADEAPPGYRRITVRGFDFFMNDKHIAWLAELSSLYELVWATMWEQHAPRHVAPLYELPSDMPVIEFNTLPVDGNWKLPDVGRFCSGRPLAWIDDDLTNDVYTWAKTRQPPTLLIKPDPTLGMTQQHVDQLTQFARTRKTG